MKIYNPEKARPQVQGLIFDMDGVLFDTERDGIEFAIQIAAEAGYTITREFAIENLGLNREEEEASYARALGPGFDAWAFWEKYWQRRREKYAREGMPVKEGAVSLLRAAREKGLPCAVASSSPAEEVRLSLELAGLTPYFSAVIGGDMVRRSKPEPEIFLTAAGALGLPPDRCLVIEDSLNGLRAARAAGAVSVFVRDIPEYPEETLQKYCDLRFDSAAEIAQLL